MEAYCAVVARHEDWEVLQKWLEDEMVTQAAPDHWISARLLIKIQQSLEENQV